MCAHLIVSDCSVLCWTERKQEKPRARLAGLVAVPSWHARAESRSVAKASMQSVQWHVKSSATSTKLMMRGACAACAHYNHYYAVGNHLLISGRKPALILIVTCTHRESSPITLNTNAAAVGCTRLVYSFISQTRFTRPRAMRPYSSVQKTWETKHCKKQGTTNKEQTGQSRHPNSKTTPNRQVTARQLYRPSHHPLGGFR